MGIRSALEKHFAKSRASPAVTASVIFGESGMIKPLSPSKTVDGYMLPCGAGVKTLPYKYQQEGIATLSKHKYLGLFDVPGLGKSLQLIYTSLNLMYLGRADCLIVVCRRSHKEVWVDEQLPDHAPHLSIFSVLGMPLQERKRPWPLNKNVYVINYELLSLALGKAKDVGGPDVIKLDKTVLRGPDARNLYNLLRTRKCIIALDESHAIANPTSKVTRVLHALAPLAEHRYISTGTPAAERPDNLWSQIYFLDQGKILGKDYWKFLDEYAIWQETRDGRRWIKKFRNLGKLQKVIKPIYIRRTDLSELPEKVVKPPIYLTPYQKQAGLLAKIRGILVSVLLAESSKGGRKVSLDPKSAFGGAFHRINRASACPWLLDPSIKESAKMDDVGEFLDEIGDQSIIIWCVNRNVAEAACNWISARHRDRSPVFIHGGVPHKERAAKLSAFKTGRVDTLCATMDSLKEAQTLTVAHYAYYLQFNFSLLSWAQTQKRIHRISQKHTVIIRTSFVDGSLDEFAFNKVVRKEGNSAKVMGDLSKDPEISIDELLAALGYSRPVNGKKGKNKKTY